MFLLEGMPMEAFRVWNLEVGAVYVLERTHGLAPQGLKGNLKGLVSGRFFKGNLYLRRPHIGVP